MPKVTKDTAVRIQKFRLSWREMAPEASFAGMTLAQFEEAVSGSLAVRDEIESLESQLDGKKAEKLIADAAANEVLDLVVNSVRGTPGFGQDCPLYRAFGYVRKSERKSGLTRKAGKTTVDANAA